NPIAPVAQNRECPQAPTQPDQSSLESVNRLPRSESDPPQTSWSHRKAASFVFSAVLLVLAGFGASKLLRLRTAPRFETIQFSKLTQRESAEDVAISPDGRLVIQALREKNGAGLWLRDIATGNVEPVLAAGPEFHGLTFSPDGNYVYFVRSDQKDRFFKY